MAYLLDTNVIIWVAESSYKLGASSRKIIEQEICYVSSVSIAEYSIKAINGKLGFNPKPEELVVNFGVELLPLSAESAYALHDLKGLANHDPFDRLLLAQAKTEGLILLTSDQTLLALNLPFIQDSRL